MNKFLGSCTALILALTMDSSRADRWDRRSVEDPVGAGQCDVLVPLSRTSDNIEADTDHNVPWPRNLLANVWFCEDSGYVSFMSDFDDMSGEEVAHVKRFLSRIYTPDLRSMAVDSWLIRLELLERVYRHREVGHDFWPDFYRTKAVLLERVAENYRMKFYSILAESVQEEVEVDCLDALVACRYACRLGIEEDVQQFLPILESVRCQSDRVGKACCG